MKKAGNFLVNFTSIFGIKMRKPKKPKCEYGCHLVWLEVAKRYTWFCNKCGEYITKDTGCSNPFCPEIIKESNE